MDSSLMVGNEGRVRDPRRISWVLTVSVALAVGLAIVRLVEQAEPASAQISIGSITCPILASLSAVFGGFFAGIFFSLLAAFGCS